MEFRYFLFDVTFLLRNLVRVYRRKSLNGIGTSTKNRTAVRCTEI